MLNELAIELVIREMLIFKHCSMDSKEIKCLFQWWAKHEIRFLIVGFLTHQILRIVGSQIKILKKFMRILTIKKFKKKKFVRKIGQMIFKFIVNNLSIWLS
jgi:hypothetical protein